jgi:hypothetical protein
MVADSGKDSRGEIGCHPVLKIGNAEVGCVGPKGARYRNWLCTVLSDYWTAGCKPRHNVKLRPWYKMMSTKHKEMSFAQVKRVRILCTIKTYDQPGPSAGDSAG